jgi:hypothetical protein
LLPELNIDEIGHSTEVVTEALAAPVAHPNSAIRPFPCTFHRSTEGQRRRRVKTEFAMSRSAMITVLAMLVALGGAAVASAQTCTVTALGTYHGESSALPREYLAMGQNSSGGDTVVGNLEGDGAYYWSGANAQESSGSLLDEIKPGGSSATQFNAVSANGSLALSNIGQYVYQIPGTTSSGTSLASYNLGSDVGYGVNNAGDIATSTHYLLPSGASYTVGTLPGLSGLPSGFQATDMSGNGIIVGCNFNDAIPEEWTPIASGGAITGYNNPAPLAGNNGSTYGVNNAGQAVGSAAFDGSAPAAEPALFSGGQSYALFPQYDHVGTQNPTTGYAFGINDQGVVVGEDNWATDFGTGFDSHGFIWTPTTPNGVTGTLQDMNTVFASALTGAWAGYVITDGLAINDNGDVLVLMYPGGGGGNNESLVALLSTPWSAQHNPGQVIAADPVVDINDLTVVLANFGRTGCAWSQGCIDGDPTGTVDVNDLTIVLAHFGTTYGAGTGIGAVPEPTVLAMLAAMLAAAVWATVRRRR